MIVTNQNKHNVSRNCRNVFLGASETHEDTFTLAPTSHRAAACRRSTTPGLLGPNARLGLGELCVTTRTCSSWR